jgi:hypothetical protein
MFRRIADIDTKIECLRRIGVTLHDCVVYLDQSNLTRRRIRRQVVNNLGGRIGFEMPPGVSLGHRISIESVAAHGSTLIVICSRALAIWFFDVVSFSA